MGPNETAITITGGPRKISVFDVQGRAKAQIKHFFGMQDGSRTPSGLGPLLVRRLHRTRCCAGHAIALKESRGEIKEKAKVAKAGWAAEHFESYGMPRAAACAV